MATRFTLPQTGESVTEGTIGTWLKQEGDAIKKYEPIVEVITDKVNVEIPSPVNGTLSKILVPEGTTVNVGAEIAEIEEEGAPTAPPTTHAEPPAEVPPAARAPGAPPAGEPTEAAAEGRQRFTPRVRRLAEEHNVDLSQVQGTGSAGRITPEDVLAFVEAQRAAPTPAAPAAPAPPPAPAAPPPPAAAAAPQTQPVAAGPDEEVLPLSAVRRSIAEHMAHSVHTAAHAWLVIEVDMTRLVQWRERIKDEFRAREGVNLTYLPFVIKGVSEALKEYPMVNATWGEDKIILKKRVNIGIAVDIPDGLIVPVIHDADQKSIVGLSKTIDDLVGRARSRRLRPEDVQGGTFTVDNTGAFGTLLTIPVINYPQAAILTTETIQRRPVVVDDGIAIRSIMNVCIGFDHRVLDGAIVGRFANTVRRRLESFGPDTPLS